MCQYSLDTRMKITRVSAYKVLLPLVDKEYNWADGKGVTEFDSTVVKVETDSGIVGWGEVRPWGPFHKKS